MLITGTKFTDAQRNEIYGIIETDCVEILTRLKKDEKSYKFALYICEYWGDDEGFPEATITNAFEMELLGEKYNVAIELYREHGFTLKELIETFNNLKIFLRNNANDFEFVEMHDYNQ